MTHELTRSGRAMVTGLLVAAVLAVGTWTARQEAEASDPFGVYAIVDSAEIEPAAADLPATLRIAGLLSVAAGRAGGQYRSPRLGSVRVTAGDGPSEKITARWAEIAAAAGTGKVVAFGSRRGLEGVQVAPPGEDPIGVIDDTHGMGVRVLESARYGPAAALRSYPRIVSPVGEVAFEVHRRYGAMGSLLITVKNPAAAPDGYRLLFETERANGDIVASGPVAPGDGGRTTFEEFRFFAEGERVTYRVRAVHEDLQHVSVAVGTFRVVAKSE